MFIRRIFYNGNTGEVICGYSMAREPKVAKYLQDNDICTLFVRYSILFTASSAALLSGCIYRCVVENLVCRMTR